MGFLRAFNDSLINKNIISETKALSDNSAIVLPPGTLLSPMNKAVTWCIFSTADLKKSSHGIFESVQ
jgi:hypothetical protein